MRAKPRHVFVPDAATADWAGRPGCRECPLPKDHDIHQVPEISQAARDRDAAILGERE